MLSHTPEAHTSAILIFGLGNPILGDDGVGWRVAEEVQARLQSNPQNFEYPDFEIDCLSVGGLSLMERMVGYDRAILIDAMFTGKAALGTVSVFDLKELPNRAWGHLTSSHDTTLQNALEVGRQMGAHLPDWIQIVGVEARNVFDFSENLSPEVAPAVKKAADQVVRLLTGLTQMKEDFRI